MPPRRAALALIASLALASSSCLVTSLESFPDPPQTPPFLTSANATPPTRQLVLVNPVPSDPITFSAYVRSEDAGAQLFAQLQLDWPQNPRGTIGISQLPSGSFSEQRLLLFSLDPDPAKLYTIQGEPIQSGCHSFTLVVTHRFNVSLNTPADPSDSDTLVWWVFIGTPEQLASFDLSTCPMGTQLPATLPTSTTQNLPPSP